MEKNELRLAEEYHRGYEDGKRSVTIRPDMAGGRSVYLSGPMSGLPHNNAEEFALWHSLFREKGISDVYDPAYEWMSDGGDHTHEEYLRRTIHQLTRPEGYDYIVMLPGWEKSEGAKTEKVVAEACGINVLYAVWEDERP